MRLMNYIFWLCFRRNSGQYV